MAVGADGGAPICDGDVTVTVPIALCDGAWEGPSRSSTASLVLRIEFTLYLAFLSPSLSSQLQPSQAGNGRKEGAHLSS